MADEAIRGLEERLRSFACAFRLDGYHPTAATMNEAAEALASLRGRVEELTQERDAPDAGLWRFWNQKAREYLSRALAAEAKAGELERANQNLHANLRATTQYKTEAEDEAEKWLNRAAELEIERKAATAKVERLERAAERIKTETAPYCNEDGHTGGRWHAANEIARALSQEQTDG